MRVEAVAVLITEARPELVDLVVVVMAVLITLETMTSREPLTGVVAVAGLALI
jgi:hypothetical protein